MNKYLEYERRKKQILENAKNAEEYERKIRELVNELRI
jgi:hypothetical protein